MPRVTVTVRAGDPISELGVVSALRRRAEIRLLPAGPPDEQEEVAAVAEVPVEAGGRGFRLGDVATVTRGFEDPPDYLIRQRGRPALAIAQLWLRPDVGALLETLQVSPGQFAARPMPAIAARRPGGAGRYLDMLAQDLRSGWSDPEAMRRLIVARQSGPGGLRDPALPALERIHSIAATGSR